VEVETDLANAKSTLEQELNNTPHEQTTEINKVAESLEQGASASRVDLQSNLALEKAMRQEYADYQNRINKLDRNALLIQQLAREKSVAEASLLQYQREYEEARMQDELNRDGIINVVPISPVWANPNPVKPNTPLLLKLALGLGLIVAIGFGFLLEILDHRLKSDSDTEGYLGVPVLTALDQYAPAEICMSTAIPTPAPSALRGRPMQIGLVLFFVLLIAFVWPPLPPQGHVADLFSPKDLQQHVSVPPSSSSGSAISGTAQQWRPVAASPIESTRSSTPSPKPPIAPSAAPSSRSSRPTTGTPHGEAVRVTVLPQETLYRICVNNLGRYDQEIFSEIRALNPELTDPTQIKVGQTILLPAMKSASARVQTASENFVRAIPAKEVAPR
jgi:hypothetical protein